MDGRLDGTTWWARDADEPVLAASLMKVPVAMAATALDLDREVLVHPDFDSVVAGERFELDEEGDQDPDTWAEVGSSQTLRELRRRSIMFSGNLATNLVMELTGVAAVTELMPQVRRMISDRPATDAGIVNAASARDWGRFLGRVPTEVEDVMRGQTYRSGIPAGLPPGTQVANKTGWIDDHTHDMAIVRPEGGPPFALVVLTRLAGVPTDEGNARIADAARDAWGGGHELRGHHRAGRGGAAEPAAALAVHHRAASGDLGRQRDRAGDRQRRPGRSGRGAAELARARRVGGRLRGLPRGPAARGGAGPDHGPVRRLAGHRPHGRRQHPRQGCAGQRPARPGRPPTLELPTLVTVPVGEPDQIAETARLRVSEGFRTLKLKVGTDAATDVARVRACREGAGPDVALRVDANTGWDCLEAVRVIRALEDAGVDLELVEQPVGRRDLLGLAHVRRHVETPVMADESVFDLEDLVALVRHRAADLVNLKISKSGGITPALELADVARKHGLGVSVGCMIESAVGVSAAAALAARVECDLEPDLDGAWWLADGAPYAERVAYADGQVLGRMDDMRASREVGVHREPDESSERVTSLAFGEEVFVVEARRSGPGCSRRTSRPTSTRPVTPAGSAATRSRRTTRSRWRAASSARRTSGAGWATRASTARGWCTSASARSGRGCPATPPTRRRPPYRSGPAPGRPLLLRSARRDGQPRGVRDRPGSAARQRRGGRGRAGDARRPPGHAARRRSTSR